MITRESYYFSRKKLFVTRHVHHQVSVLFLLRSYFGKTSLFMTHFLTYKRIVSLNFSVEIVWYSPQLCGWCLQNCIGSVVGSVIQATGWTDFEDNSGYTMLYLLKWYNAFVLESKENLYQFCAFISKLKLRRHIWYKFHFDSKTDALWQCTVQFWNLICQKILTQGFIVRSFIQSFDLISIFKIFQKG